MSRHSITILLTYVTRLTVNEWFVLESTLDYAYENRWICLSTLFVAFFEPHFSFQLCDISFAVESKARKERFCIQMYLVKFWWLIGETVIWNNFTVS
jgi:hypothetical protein